jgi:serine/threonine protein kinase
MVMIKSAANEGLELLMADPSFDVWSLGCILYQFCHPGKRALFAADQHDNMSSSADSSESLWTLASWGRRALASKLNEITDDKARNLITQMLSRDPSRRPSLSRVTAHPFFTGKVPTRMAGQTPGYDVFLSYRVASDSRHVEYLYNLLKAKGLKVWWDKVCLEDGVPWEQGFCSGLIDSEAFVCLLSKEAINHPQRPWQNFSQLDVHSKCDNVFLELRLALELR